MSRIRHEIKVKYDENNNPVDILVADNKPLNVVRSEVNPVTGGISLSAGGLPITNPVNNVDYAAKLTAPGYINTAGSLLNSDINWFSTSYILVAPGDVIDFSVIGHAAVNTISFFDTSKIYISGVAGIGGGEAHAGTASVPAGACYARFSCGNPSTYPAAFGTTPKIRSVSSYPAIIEAVKNISLSKESPVYQSRRKLVLQPSDKIMLYGDSISSTDYPWYQSEMATLTGATVYNGGFSGASSAQLAANSYMQRIFDYGGRVVIAMTGGNDSGAAGTVGTFDGSVAGESIVTESSIAGDYAGSTYIQSISHIIRKFQAQYSDIRARAGLTGSENEAQKTAKIDAVLKPVLVFCTPLPQKRNNSSDAFSLAANWKRKRDAVVECCAKYGVHCVDLYSKVPFDMAAEPYWTSPTVMNVNNGINTMDGLHPNKYGYRIISEIVCAELGI